MEKDTLRALVLYGKRYASSENTISLKRMSGFWQDRFLTKSRLRRGMEEIKRGQILLSFVPGMRRRKDVVFPQAFKFYDRYTFFANNGVTMTRIYALVRYNLCFHLKQIYLIYSSYIVLKIPRIFVEIIISRISNYITFMFNVI